MTKNSGSAYTPSPERIARETARRRAARRSIYIAALSTFVVSLILVIGVTTAPGWPRVQESFFSWNYAVKALPSVAQGLLLNLRVLFVCSIIIVIVGLLLALARTSKSPVLFPLRLIAAAYTDLFRGLPLLLVILLLGLGVPGLRLQGIPNSVVFFGGLALVLTYSAYVAEVLRAGIESVHPTQKMAARALGLSSFQTLRHVVLPQAIRRVVPPLLNDLVSLQKDSGLISVLGAIDAIKAAQVVTARTFNFTPYVVAGVLFVLLTIPLTRITDHISSRMERERAIGGNHE
jgi:polar amino acid transport system permease protein